MAKKSPYQLKVTGGKNRRYFTVTKDGQSCYTSSRRSDATGYLAYCRHQHRLAEKAAKIAAENGQTIHPGGAA